MTDYQKLLFPYAYNILGSSEDARDAIQEVIFRFTAKKLTPDDQKNYLIRGVINESINLKKKKSRIHETDNWLPEPIATDKSDLALELNELVSYSILILLEKLNPKERAVFILKEAFAYTHPEIAEVLSVSVEASRKLLSRAHQKIGQPAKAAIKRQEHADVLEKFVSAIQNKDLDRLHDILSDDIAFTADGGDKVQVLKKYCKGKVQVADLLLLVYQTYQTDYTIAGTWINHHPALIYSYKGKVMTCQVFHIGDNSQIISINTVVDPDKLKNLSVNG
ncbi:sigma-70 family RNA polymerase sigma factor [Fulvivirga ulvae]|uniref:sigma-70 family RNA polymerase sigma factor n=1 Tax=Fulvivirga ulvae TaxID=2904245 RepID=UPI001F28F1F6|nr:sigma-70 family RNA polymerase sigma factor [Fulvivirga ulvae]UII31102.1 sigma-70 family RNA polymerase sigma factor [Fulvivirga ulvae]